MRNWLFALVLLLLPVAGFAAKGQYKTDSISVLADASLAPAMAEIAKIYAERRNISVIFTFDSAFELSQRINSGESADVFIADHPRWIEELKQKGVIDVYSLHTIAHNRLVLALPASSMLRKRLSRNVSFDDALNWLSGNTLFVLADPDTTSLGIYTRQVLTASGRWAALQEKTIRAANSQQAAFLTAENNAAGIVYASDIEATSDLTKITDVPAKLHTPVTYIAAAVASENMAQARKFLEFLGSQEAKAIYAKHGLLP